MPNPWCIHDVRRVSTKIYNQTEIDCSENQHFECPTSDNFFRRLSITHLFMPSTSPTNAHGQRSLTRARLGLGFRTDSANAVRIKSRRVKTSTRCMRLAWTPPSIRRYTTWSVRLRRILVTLYSRRVLRSSCVYAGDGLTWRVAVWLLVLSSACISPSRWLHAAFEGIAWEPGFQHAAPLFTR